MMMIPKSRKQYEYSSHYYTCVELEPKEIFKKYMVESLNKR